VEESKKYEAEDKKRREVIDARNNADNLVYQTEKSLRELGEKVSSAERGKIEGKISDLKQAAQGDDLNRIKKATDELQNMFYALSQQMYAQDQKPPEGGPGQAGPGQAGSGQAGTPPSGGNDGDVIEGEVRDA
jgi:molecular chaperone DnaK